MNKAEVIQWVMEKGGAIVNMDQAIFNRKTSKKRSTGLQLNIGNMTTDEFSDFKTRIETFLYR